MENLGSYHVEQGCKFPLEMGAGSLKMPQSGRLRYPALRADILARDALRPGSFELLGGFKPAKRRLKAAIRCISTAILPIIL